MLIEGAEREGEVDKVGAPVNLSAAFLTIQFTGAPCSGRDNYGSKVTGLLWDQMGARGRLSFLSKESLHKQNRHDLVERWYDAVAVLSKCCVSAK